MTNTRAMLEQVREHIRHEGGPALNPDGSPDYEAEAYNEGLHTAFDIVEQALAALPGPDELTSSADRLRDVVESLEIARTAYSEDDLGPRGRAQTAIADLLLLHLLEQQTQTLIAYLQTLVLNPAPSAETVAQITVVAGLIEDRLGIRGNGQ